MLNPGQDGVAAPGAQPALLPFRPTPTESIRPWAGARLAAAERHIGELWLAGPDSTTPDGTQTLDDLARLHGEALVGTQGMALLGARFPLLAKLIDAADWLSLQVHPDDALARELYGPDAVGKVEAWVVLDDGPTTPFVTGPAAGIGPDALRALIANGSMDLEHCATTVAAPGDVMLLRAGTIHAIGAGAFVYEIEQPSDLTFRISDWHRATGRALHIAESLRAVDPSAHAVPCGTGFRIEGGVLEVPEFRLELVDDSAGAVTRRPGGRSLELLTVLHGTAVARGDGWSDTLEATATLVVPASIDAYVLEAGPDSMVAVGSIP